MHQVVAACAQRAAGAAASTLGGLSAALEQGEGVVSDVQAQLQAMEQAAGGGGEFGVKPDQLVLPKTNSSCLVTLSCGCNSVGPCIVLSFFRDMPRHSVPAGGRGSHSCPN